MSIFEVGRVCVKIAGRDAGKTCIIVEQINEKIVLVDGGTRRRKVNVNHLEPLDQTIELAEGASHDEVAGKFKKLKLAVWETKAKSVGTKPVQKRGSSSKAKAAAEAGKKEAPKAEKVKKETKQ